MQLGTLNRWLRRVGLVVVLTEDFDGEHGLELQRAKTYDRAVATKTPQTFDPWIDRLPTLLEAIRVAGGPLEIETWCYSHGRLIVHCRRVNW